tara:strand:+ start:2478 stop:3224 length:747 start_codon:yes stop_codon:yes gene_type:complete
MRAIILAAGRGSRLKSYTKKKPKCFLKIKNKTIIQHQIDALKKNDITDISVVTGYKKNYFQKLGIKIFINKKWNSTNMVYSLFQAKSWLLNYNCLVCYGDIFYSEELIKKLIESKDPFVLPSNKNWKKHWFLKYKNPLSDLETFKIDKKKNLTEIGKKAENYRQIQGQFMGLIKIKKNYSKSIFRIFKKITKKNQKKIQFTHFLNHCIENYNCKVKTFQSKAYWFEIDNKKDLKILKDYNKKTLMKYK